MEGTRLTGKVKWFNVQNGFGFITPLEPIENTQDIFVHHSSINVTGSQYRYLVEGEYVEFTLENVNSREHSFHAVDITGINRNTLMCETRNSSRNESRAYARNETRNDSRTHSRNDSCEYSRTQSNVPPGPPPLKRTQTSSDGFEFPKQKRVSKK